MVAGVPAGAQRLVYRTHVRRSVICLCLCWGEGKKNRGVVVSGLERRGTTCFETDKNVTPCLRTWECSS